MAMVRSVLARVARGRHPGAQPLLPAGTASELSLPSAGWRLQRHPAADHMSKRYLSGGKSECGLVDSLRKKYFKVDGFYYQKDLERQEKKCSDMQHKIEDLFDRSSAAGIIFPIHVRMP